ncbi:MAG: S8 family serine peptidase [Chloroflexi bacterium]|nr:S8 family serine peptidase [Chloroflexota bacterium]
MKSGGTIPTAVPAVAKPSPSPTATPSKPVLGKAEAKDPEPAKIITSKEFGEAPANQVAVVMKEGQTRQDAERVAGELGGTIVGEVEFFGMYQIETKGTTEADLKASISKASGLAGVEVAFANSAQYIREIPCKSCSPFADPFFDGENGRAYGVIGVGRAWAIMKASGVALGDVTVGVADTPLYNKSGEIKGTTNINTIDPVDQTDQPSKDKAGNVRNGGLTHSTMVTHVIGANPDNGGMAGVGSILGNHVTVTVKNLSVGQTGFSEVAADPNDPSKIVYTDGKTYTCSGFQRMAKLIQSGATIINYSWGPDHPDASLEAETKAYRIFLEKMQQKYPQVLFVAAAGNENGDLNGKNYNLGGQKLPNVITVGAIDNDGNRADFSNKATGDGEVTISAPGVDVPLGTGPDGKVVKASGTSFATPMVTAAAAMLRSINPKLTAEEIKQLLVATARRDVQNPDSKETKMVPANMGAGVLRVDEAVLKVINDKLKTEGKQALDPKRLEQLASIEGSASSKSAKEYTVKAKLDAVGSEGTDVKAEIRGGGATVTGAPSKKLAAPGEVTWEVALQDEKKKPTVRICRLDTGACCDANLEVIDLNGKWEGTMTMTDAKFSGSDIVIPDPFDDKKPPTIIKKEDCEQAIKTQLGNARPMTMDFQGQSPSTGMVTIVNVDEKGKESRSNPMPYRFDGDRVTIDGKEQGGGLHFEGRVAVGGNDYTISGPFSMTLEDKGAVVLRITGSFSVSKPKQ